MFNVPPIYVFSFLAGVIVEVGLSILSLRQYYAASLRKNIDALHEEYCKAATKIRGENGKI